MISLEEGGCAGRKPLETPRACPALACGLRWSLEPPCLPPSAHDRPSVQSSPLTEHLSAGSACRRLVRGRRSQGWAPGRGHISPLGQELTVLQGLGLTQQEPRDLLKGVTDLQSLCQKKASVSQPPSLSSKGKTMRAILQIVIAVTVHHRSSHICLGLFWKFYMSHLSYFSRQPYEVDAIIVSILLKELKHREGKQFTKTSQQK